MTFPGSRNFNKLFVDSLNVTDQRIFLRVDFNVPIADGRVVNDQRIVASMETINYCLQNGAKSVVLVTHLGRPDGRRVMRFSLTPVLPILGDLLRKPVEFLDNCVGPDVETFCENPEPGTVILLENVRFHLEEEGKGLDENGSKCRASAMAIRTFRESLRKLADIYVNDAFGMSHKSHSSMLGEGFRQRAGGFLVKRELMFFSKVIHNPERPFLAILGGSKLQEKLQVILNLLHKVDEVIIGGGMAFTFLKELRGMKIGRSLFDPAGASHVSDIMEIADRNRVKIHLPVDFVTGSNFSDDAQMETTSVDEGIREGWLGLDVGVLTRERFREPIARAKLILWNGPPGVFEFRHFSDGTWDMMNAIVDATRHGTLTILCGTDTASICNKWNTVHKVTHVTSGGSASLELLEGKLLPGIDALSEDIKV